MSCPQDKILVPLRLGVLFKISDEHPRHFYMGVSPPGYIHHSQGSGCTLSTLSLRNKLLDQCNQAIRKTVNQENLGLLRSRLAPGLV